jgi:hypothetical protein
MQRRIQLPDMKFHGKFSFLSEILSNNFFQICLCLLQPITSLTTKICAPSGLGGDRDQTNYRKPKIYVQTNNTIHKFTMKTREMAIAAARIKPFPLIIFLLFLLFYRVSSRLRCFHLHIINTDIRTLPLV